VLSVGQIAGALDPVIYQGARPPKGSEASASSTALLRKFLPRVMPGAWPATEQTKQQVVSRLLAEPFTLDSGRRQQDRRRGLVRMLDWLEAQPGETWQDRWAASAADAEGNVAWRRLPAQWLACNGHAVDDSDQSRLTLSRGMSLLVSGDVIRPTLGWLLTPATPHGLVADLARTRDPDGFATLTTLCRTDVVNAHTTQLALRRIATIVAAKGGRIADINIGDCLELLRLVDDSQASPAASSPYFYQLLRTAEVFGEAAPAVRALKTQGQLSCEQLIDRYAITCDPVRDLLVDYLRERQPGVDYATLHKLSYTLGRLFWRDLEIHHPGIDSLRLSANVATAWKQRINTKTHRVKDVTGQISQVSVPRINAVEHLITVRAFYLDIAQWAADDPARWGPWVVPCPIRDLEASRVKRSARKSRMDQRTRERMPVLIETVNTAHKAAAERLHAAQAVTAGELFTAAGANLRRSRRSHATAGITWAEDPHTGKRRDLSLEEHQAFWTWAAVEVLRHTGIRIEELTELSHHSLSHHSLIQYRLPATDELIPLLQIAPSKTDTERLLVISPELADVLSTIICRIRDENGAVPLVIAYDYHERVWNPPIPLLFQRRYGGEHRPITGPAVRELIADALAGTGLTDASGRPLRFVPHDFRRILITDAIMHGMPPHIAQLVAGHRDINVTMGYKAVYPEEVINGHRAFIARRRALRPSEEYRTPTEQEWTEFLGHFERRKVSLGTCGRSYSTACIHEHACIRCPLLRPDPAQRHRLVDICRNLEARIDEAQRENWLGEVDGLQVSLAAARNKLVQLDELATRSAAIPLGMPTTGPTR
jgi:hypothetical protein